MLSHVITLSVSHQVVGVARSVWLNSGFGRRAAACIQMAVDEINSAATILPNNKFIILFNDSESNQQRALRLATDMVLNLNVMAV
jgi:ABC-type branched-subunit amino acid transport system substrate-binding protein